MAESGAVTAQTKKPIIAVDIDEVLVQHFPDLIAWHNLTYGTKLTLANHGAKNRPADIEPWGATSYEEAVRRAQGFFDTPQFLQAEPYDMAVAVLRRLSRRYELIIVTARDTIVEEVTRRWLDKHFADIFTQAHFTALYSLEGKTRSKIEVCLSVGADYLIDDDLGNAQTADQAGIKVVLFGNYLWNKAGRLPRGVTRCDNWPAVEVYFDARG